MNQLLKIWYNNNTKTLIIPHYFNEKINKFFHKTKIIIFYEKYPNCSIFNQKIDNLQYCLCLTHLTFGNNFNQKVDNLPKNLTHLTFDRYFNQKIDNLPITLKEIKIYNKELIKKFPFGCKIIEIKNKKFPFV
jgi:hypothetical protein